MSQPEPLQLFVADSVATQDVPPGGAPPASPTSSLTPDEIQVKRGLVDAERARVMARYVDPHKTKSRWVKTVDIPRVIEDGKDMLLLCTLPRGLAHHAKAIAHPQIDTDPLRFFVLDGNGKPIINPVIVSHTKAHVFKDGDACMSYPGLKALNNVPRFNKITVMYQELGRRRDTGEIILTPPVTEDLSGEQSWIFQHECDHLNGGYVYDADYTPERAIGFGAGEVDPTELTKQYEIKKEKEEEAPQTQDSPAPDKPSGVDSQG